MKAEKRAIRRELSARRRGLPQQLVAEASAAVQARVEALPAFRSAASIVAYLATDNEVETGRLIAGALAAGKRVLLPRISDGPAVVPWRLGEPLACVRPGLYEPAAWSREDTEAPQVAVIPVVGWDGTGVRLGRGGGYFDRLFATMGDGILRVGLAYEFQHVSGLPRDAWDVPVHMVITEQRVLQCGLPVGMP